MKHPKNQGLFTEDRHENAEKYWSLVDKKGPDRCWLWNGPSRTYISKRQGKRTFGVYFGVKPENGYVMNQRFAYIVTHPDLPPTEFDSIKVRPTDDCRLPEPEMCCNPRHIKRTD